jgi:hypothetical protein
VALLSALPLGSGCRAAALTPVLSFQENDFLSGLPDWLKPEWVLKDSGDYAGYVRTPFPIGLTDWTDTRLQENVLKSGEPLKATKPAAKKPVCRQPSARRPRFPLTRRRCPMR